MPEKRYGVILADPGWRFQTYSRETGMDRAADNHYATETVDKIKALGVKTISAADCVLFLWATVPMLPQALEVMRAWGFAYKTGFVWAKDKIGTGYWNRNQHELLLVGTRGRVPAPAMGTQRSSLIAAPVRGHSRKPDEVYAIIESHFPTLPKIELHARGLSAPWLGCMGAGSATDMNALKVAAIGAEAAVIGSLAVSSYYLAGIGNGGDWLAGAPLVTVAAFECMPLAFRLPRLRLMGLASGVAILAGLKPERPKWAGSGPSLATHVGPESALLGTPPAGVSSVRFGHKI